MQRTPYIRLVSRTGIAYKPHTYILPLLHVSCILLSCILKRAIQSIDLIYLNMPRTQNDIKSKLVTPSFAYWIGLLENPEQRFLTKLFFVEIICERTHKIHEE